MDGDDEYRKQAADAKRGLIAQSVPLTKRLGCASLKVGCH
jgi:hypothetical protein